LATFEA